MTNAEAHEAVADFFEGCTPQQIADFVGKYYRDGIWASPFGFDEGGRQLAPFGVSKHWGIPKLHPKDQ